MAPKYQPIPSSPILEQHQARATAVRARKGPSLVLSVSAICNIILAIVSYGLHMHSSQSRYLRTTSSDSTSLYAQVEKNAPIPIMESTPYSGHNISEVGKVWEDISIDDGMVALADEFVEQHGLPTAQRYPWDKSKGSYFLKGYHNPHCLRAVHISLMEFAHGEKQSRRFHHVLHCMESLRQDILCNADDTPRYTTADAVPESGVGQLRQCRDRGKLETWARQHNARYHFTNQTATGFPNVLRYTFSPPDSPDLPRVEAIMGGGNLTDLIPR